MVKFPILQDPAVKYWFGGIEHVWTLLNETRFASLSRSPSPLTGPIRVATDLTYEEVQQSALARNTLDRITDEERNPLAYDTG